MKSNTQTQTIIFCLLSLILFPKCGENPHYQIPVENDVLADEGDENADVNYMADQVKDQAKEINNEEKNDSQQTDGSSDSENNDDSENFNSDDAVTEEMEDEALNDSTSANEVEGDVDEEGGEDGLFPCYGDKDNDGYGNPDDVVWVYDIYGTCPEGYITLRVGDCNDSDPQIHWGAEEICDDEIDNDCDGEIDEGCSDDDGCDGHHHQHGHGHHHHGHGHGYGHNCDNKSL